MKYLFIINPIAGKGRGLEYISKIEEYFKNKDAEFHIKLTQYKDHGEEIVKEFCSNSTYHVFAIGGDGTVNEVLNGLVGTNSFLSIIPCGTGNDFVKTLYENVKPEDYLHSLTNGIPCSIDLASVNERYYLNISSVGFDAEVAYNARKFKYHKYFPNSLSYLTSIFYTAFKFKAMDLNILVDNNYINQKTFLLAVSNGKCYGGGVFITPDANIIDGNLDICSVKKVTIFKLLMSLKKAFDGNIKDIKEVSYHNCKKAIISSPKEFALNVDGELLRTNHAEFSVIHKGLNVILPQESLLWNSSLEDAINL
ncbi:Diacylglycerol kinase [bioreactor metagenome]|uniref:Diacylglycerol kinase n=1 Tax=bioreactor metagenome TaxID=1076179 RepID=A0A645BDK1_9ZZZZ